MRTRRNELDGLPAKDLNSTDVSFIDDFDDK